MNESEKSSRLRRTWIALLGGLVVIVGVIAIPYPGPGFLIVFAGLAILAQEFPWADRVLQRARKKYDNWNVWVKKQHWFVQSLIFITTTTIVIITIWLLNGYGIVADIFHLNWPWLNSPFVDN